MIAFNCIFNHRPRQILYYKLSSKTHRRNFASKRPFSHSWAKLWSSQLEALGLLEKGCAEPQPATKATGWPRTLSHSSKEVNGFLMPKLWPLVDDITDCEEGLVGFHHDGRHLENYSMTSVPIPEPHTKKLQKYFAFIHSYRSLQFHSWGLYWGDKHENLTLIGVQFALVLDTYTSCLSFRRETHTHPLDPERLLRCCSSPPI